MSITFSTCLRTWRILACVFGVVGVARSSLSRAHSARFLPRAVARRELARASSNYLEASR
jgi:hypothetical protein